MLDEVDDSATENNDIDIEDQADINKLIDSEESTKKALEFYDEETPDEKEPEKEPEKKPEKESKKESEEKSEEKPQEKVEYKIDGDGEVDQQFIELLTPALNEAGVSNDHFNDLAKSMTKYAEISAHKMEKETRDDPDFSGKDFDQKMSIAKLGFEEYGTSELTTTLANAGLLNNVEVIRAFHKMGSQLQEGGLTVKSTGNEKQTHQQMLDMMYPDQVAK